MEGVVLGVEEAHAWATRLSVRSAEYNYQQRQYHFQLRSDFDNATTITHFRGPSSAGTTAH